MYGGMAGGALTGGLEGGWKGALMGAAIGGALGAVGGWGVDRFGWGFAAGMLVAGAGVAGATNSWDSFAGGVVGGIAGYAAGSGISQSIKSNNSTSNKFAKPTNAEKDGNPNKALIVDKGKGASGDPIIDDPAVRAEMQKAYSESFSFDGKRVYEQGGWISKDDKGNYSVQRWPKGTSGTITSSPKPSNAVADFHTHPYAPYEIFSHGPSYQDYMSARMGTSYGLNHYIVDKQGIISYAPAEEISDLGTGTYKDVLKW